MPTKVLVIGDPHFKINNINDTELMVNAILVEAKSRQLDFIVVLGDTLDRHESAHESPYNRAIDFLGELMLIAPVYLLIGNHDLKNNKQFLSNGHFFNALKKWGNNMIVIDITTAVIINDMLFTFVPYVPKGRFIEALSINNPNILTKDINLNELSTSSTCIFAHQEFFGARMGSTTSEMGDKWSNTNSFIISGHFHDYHELQSNILYIGAPIQHAFGDSKKTISYFEFISLTERSQQRIDLKLRQKEVIRLTCEEVSTFVPGVNCELKILIKGNVTSINTIKSHVNVIAWKKLGHKISYKTISEQQSTITGNTKTTTQKFSITLRENISDSPDLLTLYTKLFGVTSPILNIINRDK